MQEPNLLPQGRPLTPQPPSPMTPAHLWVPSPSKAKAPQQALTVTTAGQRSFRCRSRGTMLWWTWVRRLLGSLPAIAATRSPKSAMAAARMSSRSCKPGAPTHSQTCSRVPASTQLGTSPPCCGEGAQLPQQDAFSRLRAARAGPCLPPDRAGGLHPRLSSHNHTLSTKCPKCITGVGLVPLFPSEGKTVLINSKFWKIHLP